MSWFRSWIFGSRRLEGKAANMRLEVGCFSTRHARLTKEIQCPNEESITEKTKKKLIGQTLKRINMESELLYGPLLRSAAEKRKLMGKTTLEKRCSSPLIKKVESGFKDTKVARKPAKRHIDETRITPIEEKIVNANERAHRVDKEGTSPIEQETLGHLGKDRKNLDGPVLDFTLVKEFDAKSDEGPKFGHKPHSGDGQGLECNSGHVSPPVENRGSKLLESLSGVQLLNVRSGQKLEDNFLDCHLLEMLAVKSSSITNILQKTMSPESVRILELWRRKMVNQLGEEGFQIYQQELFSIGKHLHHCIEEYLSGKSLDLIEIDDSVKGHWKSLQPILADVSDVLLLETRVHHPILQYRGILDGVVKYRGTNVLIEWKTSLKPKPLLKDTYDNPLQAAAYIGALNYGENLPFQLTEAAIVIAYPNGSPARLHFMNKDLCQFYWNQWLQRLTKFLLIDQ